MVTDDRPEFTDVGSEWLPGLSEQLDERPSLWWYEAFGIDHKDEKPRVTPRDAPVVEDTSQQQLEQIEEQERQWLERMRQAEESWRQQYADDVQEERERWQQESYQQIKDEAEKQGREEGLLRGREEAWQEGYAKGVSGGYAAGMEQAEDEIAATTKRLQGLLESLASYSLDSVGGLSEQLTILVMEIIKNLADIEAIPRVSLIRKGLEEAVAALPIRVSGLKLILHPTDKKLLRDAAPEIFKDPRWNVVTDSAVEPGGCRLEGTEVLVDASVQARIRSLVMRAMSWHDE